MLLGKEKKLDIDQMRGLIVAELEECCNRIRRIDPSVIIVQAVAFQNEKYSARVIASLGLELFCTALALEAVKVINTTDKKSES